MYNEENPCPAGHIFNGEKPKIDESIMQIQNHNLIGVICDCKKFIYWEGECGCAVKHWEIKYKQNI